MPSPFTPNAPTNFVDLKPTNASHEMVAIKKFSADWKRMHQEIMSIDTYMAIKRDLQYYLMNCGGCIVDEYGISFEKKTAKAMKRLFKFFKNPLNSLFFRKTLAIQTSCAALIEQMVDPNYELYRYIRQNEFLIADLMEEARTTLVLIVSA